MKKLAALLALVALAGVIPAHADSWSEDFVRSSRVKVGDGVSPVATVLRDCTATGPSQGQDAYGIVLPEGATGHNITVLWDDGLVGNVDFDVYFFDAGCNQLGYSGMATGSAPEKGVVPEGATYVEADLFTGVNATFLLIIDKDPAA